MKSKSVIILAVVLAALVAFIAVKKRSEKPVSIVEQAKLARLLPEGLSTGDIGKLELYRGEAPDKKVVLSREGDVWTVPSQYNAAGDAKTIDEYLGKLTALQGEPRTADVAEADLETYELSDAKAFHVVGYKSGVAEPAFHVLVGKSPRYQQVFMRRADGKDVYVSDVDFRQEAGVSPVATPMSTSGSGDQAAMHWVKKEVISVAKDEITKVELSTPDKKLVFERHEKPAAAPAESSAGPEGTAGKAPEFEWKLTQGGPASAAGTFKKAGLENLLSAFGPLNATNVVDPSKTAEYGLTPPAFTCALTVNGQEKPIVIEGGRPDLKADGYVRVAGSKGEFVYSVAAITFDRLFPRGNTLFDLPSIAVDQNQVSRIELTQPEGNLVATRKDGEWTLEQPAASLPVQSTTLDSIARTLAAWRAADYAYSEAATGLDAAARVAKFTDASGKTHTLRVGNAAAGFDGYYARIDDNPQPLAMSRTDYDSVFVAPKFAYQLDLLELIAENIEKVALDRPEGAVTLARNGEDWTLTVNGNPEPVDKAAAEAWINALAALQANDIVFGKKALDGAPTATMTIGLKDKQQHVIRFGARSDKGQPILVDGKSDVLLLSVPDSVAVLPPADSLKKKEAAVPEATDAPAATPAGS